MIARADVSGETCLTPPVDFTTPNVGGIRSGTALLGLGSFNQVHFSMGSKTVGLGSRIQYSKWHVVNTNATFDANTVKVWLENGGSAASGGSGTFSFQLSGLETENRIIRILGFNGGGPKMEDVLIRNTTRTNADLNGFDSWHTMEVRKSTGKNELVALENRLDVYFNNVFIGWIPPKMYNLIGTFSFGAGLAQDDAATITTAAVAPTSVTFSNPRTSSGAVVLGDIEATKSRALWSRWTLPERAKGSKKQTLAMGISFLGDS